jgi:hypothetical protein
MSRAPADPPAPRQGAMGGVLFRFLAGMHLDGRRRTDATFFRRGMVPTHERWFGLGGASWWAMRPGWFRAAVRLAAVAVLAGLWRWRDGTEWALVLICGPGLGVIAWRCWRKMARWRHHAGTVRPLAAALAPSLETTPEEAERTLAVPRAHGEPDAQVTIPLPDHWQGHPAQLEAVTRIASQRLGGEWVARVNRSPLLLALSHPPAPPGMVPFAQVADLIRAQGSLYRVLMGLGAGDAPHWLDFGSEIAHLGISVGTGGGKSAFLRYLIAQFAYWGVADFPVIDSKFVSLAGMESITGLVVYREPAEQWAKLAGLRKDMESRYARLLADPGAQFPLCVVTLEEQNDAAIEWRAHWREIKAPRDPATPPVYSDITRLMIKGRQVGYRFIGAYQRLTAAACGGLDAGVMRDAYGQKALARHSPQAWDSLTGIRPRPAPSEIPGRWLSVLGHAVRAVQVPYAEAPELLDFAASGTSAGVPVSRVSASTPSQDGQGDRDTAPREAVVIGLAEAADRLRMTPEAIKKARQRSPIPGEFRALDGRPGWTLADLMAWARSRPVAGERYAEEEVMRTA